MNKTGISESQATQIALQLFVVILPFTPIDMTDMQMQALASLSGALAVFAFAQWQKQKAKRDA